MDNESECDWTPPAEVELVESEVFLLPSGLPSLEEFVRTELEIKAAAAIELEEDADDYIEHQVDAEVDTEQLVKEGSFVEFQDDEVDAVAEVSVESLSDDDIYIPVIEVKKPTKPIKKVTDEWYEMDTDKIDLGDENHKMAKQAKEELRLRLISTIDDYIDNLIGKVVETCEYEDPDDILRARLNKDTVCKELDEKMLQLDVEQKKRFFLNRKTVEYFRRKKATRQLMDDSPENIVNELRKYREALMMLNHYMEREREIKQLMEGKIFDLREQVGELETKATEESRQFVSLVKNAFAIDDSDKRNSVIEYLISRMENMKKEISKVRFVLIQRQHTMANLQDKAKRLEDLGNGLRMADFEHLQTEVQALGKKIEERNNELNRLHDRCNADIHTLAHIREKKQMLRNTIAAQQEAYDELVAEKQDCREYLNGLKIERGSIRREFKKISFQGGLLDKPELLLDYDETVEKVNILQAKVNDMKAEQLVVEDKLKHMMTLLQ